MCVVLLCNLHMRTNTMAGSNRNVTLLLIDGAECVILQAEVQQLPRLSKKRKASQHGDSACAGATTRSRKR